MARRAEDGSPRKGRTSSRSPSPARRAATALAALLLAALPACESIFGPGDDPGPVEIVELPRSLTADERAVRDASNRFGFDLLGTILDDAPEETHFLSPLSASMALGMALNGADGETFEAMRSTLRFGDLSEEAVNESYRGLVDLLRDLDPTVSVELANAVWHREDLVPRSAFVSRVEEHFDAAVEGLDFADPSAPDVINGWVADATNGRIDEMVGASIPSNVVALLLNAVHFDAAWTEPFDPDATEAATFRAASGEEESVDFMHREETLPYRGTSTYDAVELPYGGEAYAMTVVVPREETTPADVVDVLADGGWGELVEGLSPQRVRVFLPRFELAWERTLNDDLSALGMEVAFLPGSADFTRMFENAAPWVDEVKQKSFVRVDEEGTEAAAVTSVTVVDSAPPTVRADRPFLFVLRERLSGTILFVGAVLEPPPPPS